MKFLLYLGTAFSIVGLVTACGQKGEHHTGTGDTAHEGHDHWGYLGNNSPEHWAELSPEFIKCAEGHAQSPIDIESNKTSTIQKADINFDYQPSDIAIVNTGHSIQANFLHENTMTFKGHSYSLVQAHFHAPSEHQVDGVIYPMEVHLVHQDTQGHLAVVGVLVKEGNENDQLPNLSADFPKDFSEVKAPNSKCYVEHLLPTEKTAFNYGGSLPPPCTEGVQWLVMKNPLEMSRDQINKFKQHYLDNNRPVQEKHERTIEASLN